MNKSTFQSFCFLKYTTLLFLFVFTFSASFGQICGTAQIVNTTNPITGVTITPTLTGAADATWTKIVPNPITHVVQTGSKPGGQQPDYSAQWRAQWDATNLYVLVQVTDVILNWDHLANDNYCYNYDEVEIYLSGNRNMSTTYGAQDVQYEIYYNNDGSNTNSIVKGGGTITTAGVTSKTMLISPSQPFGTGLSGYNMIITIPWSKLGVTPINGNIIGFDVDVSDNDHTSDVPRVAAPTDYNNFYTANIAAGQTPAQAESNADASVNANTTDNGLYTDGRYRDAQIAWNAPVGNGNDYNNPSLFASTPLTGLPTQADAGKDLIICGTTPTSLAALAPSTGETGLWSIAAGSKSTALSQFVDVTSNTTKFTASGGAGIYNLIWTVYNNPCTYITSASTAGETAPTMATIKVTVNPADTATVSASATICANTATTVTFTGTPNATLNYSITKTNGTVITTPAPIVFDASGNAPAVSTGNLTDTIIYKLGLVSGGTLNCPQTLTTSSTIFIIPAASFTSSTISICAGNAATNALKISGTPANAAITYYPTTKGVKGANVTINLSGGTYTLPSTGILNDTTIYTLKIAGTCTPTTAQTDTINVVPSPTAAFASSDTTICNGNTATINFVGTKGATVTYNTKDLKTGVASANTTLVLDATTGTSSVTTASLTDTTVFQLVSASNSTGCSRPLTTSDTVNVLLVPTGTIAGDVAFCPNSTAKITFTGQPLDSLIYTITANSITSGNNSIGLNNSGNAVLTPIISTNTVYTLIGAKHPGKPSCFQSLSGTATVKISAPDVTSFTPAQQTICSNGTVILTLIGTPNSTVNYIDSLNNGTISAVKSKILDASGNGTITTPALTDTITYKLRTVVGSTATCTKILSLISVINVVPTPTATLTALSSSVCSGTATKVAFAGTKNALVNYTINGAANTLTLSAIGADTVITQNLTSSATYTISSVQYAGSPSCPATISGQSQTIAVTSVLPPTITSSTLNYCQNNTALQLSATASAGDTLIWDAPSLYQDTRTAPIPSTATAGTQIFYVRQKTSQAQGGCESTKDTITVNVSSVSAYAGGPVVSVLKGLALILQGVATPSNATILWTTASGIPISDVTIAMPTVGPFLTFPATAQLFVMNVTSGACSTADTVKIIVLQPLVIPNVFTPNGDGVHDFWVIQNLNQYPSAEIRIFNRYGQIVLTETSGYTKPWDGTANGQPLPTGAYYYIIKLNDGSEPISGSVAIIR